MHSREAMATPWLRLQVTLMRGINGSIRVVVDVSPPYPDL